jgi:peptidoglycan hydrolase CwlO-like protein
MCPPPSITQLQAQLDEEQASLEAASSSLAAREAALAGRQSQLEALEGAAAEALQEARDAAAAALAERDQVRALGEEGGVEGRGKLDQKLP